MILHPCPYCNIRAQLPEVGRCEDPDCMRAQRQADGIARAKKDPEAVMKAGGVPMGWLAPGYTPHEDVMFVTASWRHGGIVLADAVREHIRAHGTPSMEWIEGCELHAMTREQISEAIDEAAQVDLLAVNGLRLKEDAALQATFAKLRQPHGRTTLIAAYCDDVGVSEFGVGRLLEAAGLRDLFRVVVSHPEEKTAGEETKP